MPTGATHNKGPKLIENPTPDQEAYAEQVLNALMESMFVTTERGLVAGPLSPQAAAKMCQDYEDRQREAGLEIDNARLSTVRDMIMAGCAAIAAGTNRLVTAVDMLTPEA